MENVFLTQNQGLDASVANGRGVGEQVMGFVIVNPGSFLFPYIGLAFLC